MPTYRENNPLYVTDTNGNKSRGFNVHRNSDAMLTKINDMDTMSWGRVDFKIDHAYVQGDEGYSFDFGSTGADVRRVVNTLAGQDPKNRVVAVLQWGANSGSWSAGPQGWGSGAGSLRQKWLDFCAAAVQEFDAEGIVWEIANEPNLSTYWGTGYSPDADVYAQLVFDTIVAMRAVETEAEWIFFGALAPNAAWPASKAYALADGNASSLDADFLGDLLAWNTTIGETAVYLLNSGYADGVSFHTYSNPVEAQATVLAIRDAIGSDSVPVLCTECGVDIKSLNSGRPAFFDCWEIPAGWLGTEKRTADYPNGTISSPWGQWNAADPCACSVNGGYLTITPESSESSPSPTLSGLKYVLGSAPSAGTPVKMSVKAKCSSGTLWVAFQGLDNVPHLRQLTTTEQTFEFSCYAPGSISHFGVYVGNETYTPGAYPDQEIILTDWSVKIGDGETTYTNSDVWDAIEEGQGKFCADMALAMCNHGGVIQVPQTPRPGAEIVCVYEQLIATGAYTVGYGFYADASTPTEAKAGWNGVMPPT